MLKLDASKSGSFRIGGEIEVNRLGFGAMRLTGRGIWGCWTLFQSLASFLDSSDEIPFAQFNTAVPQDVVGRGAVEIKVGQHEMYQIGLAFETHRVFAKG